MRKVRQDLSAFFGSMTHPAVSTLVSCGSAALAFPLATRGGYAGTLAAACVFFLSVLFLGYMLGSGALAFAVDAKRSCLPGWQRLARRANLVASMLLVPALAIPVAALAGNPVWPAWIPAVLMFAVALAGILAPRQSTYAVGLLPLVALAAYWAASGRAGHARGMEWRFALLSAAVVLLPAAFVLLGLAIWRREMRPGSRAPSLAARLRTACHRIGPRQAFERAPLSSSWQPSSRRGPRERQSPVRIVRTCLGGIFTQFSRQLIIGAALLALFVVAAIWMPRLGASGTLRAIALLALAAAGLLSSGFLTQLSRLTRGQIAELALMPGLGSPAAQRRALCRVVLTPPLFWLGVVLLFGSADLLLKGEPLSSVRLLAVSLLILWLAYTVLALQKLATLPPKPQSFISELMLLGVVVYAFGTYYWIYATQPRFDLWFWFWITPILIGVVIASVIGFSVWRLAAAPHPFLYREH